jgi:hypothetical protein
MGISFAAAKAVTTSTNSADFVVGHAALPAAGSSLLDVVSKRELHGGTAAFPLACVAIVAIGVFPLLVGSISCRSRSERHELRAISQPSR